MLKYPQYNAKILQMLPGKGVCFDYKDCIKDCLAFKGMAKVYPKTVIGGRKKRKDLFTNDVPMFMQQLEKELNSLSRTSYLKVKTPVVRLNGFTDIDWTLPKYHINGDTIFNTYQEIYFYDYTKVFDRVINNLSRQQTFPNYHLTFSHSGYNLKDCAILHLAYNINIAVIDLPENRHSFRAADNNPIDMDLHDFRFLDKPGHIGYLSFKE